MKFGLFVENLKISINSHSLKFVATVLTVLIIAIGIMALVGILTAVESIKTTISSEFQSMGANVFTIRRQSSERHGGGFRRVERKNISYEDATFV